METCEVSIIINHKTNILAKHTQVLFNWHRSFCFSIALIFSINLLIPTINIFAQDVKKTKRSDKDKTDFDYRKKPWKGNNAFLSEYLQSINYFNNQDKVRYLVPIHFWIYRNSNGTGGAPLSDIGKYIDELNHYNKINKTGFRFYISNIKEINKTKRMILGYYLEAPLQGIFRHKKNVINVHVIDGFKLRKRERKLVRGTYNYLSKSIIMRRENSSTGLSHEVGHYFGLLHPHRNYNKGKSKQEPVSRTRTQGGNKTPLCELRGDYLSDTPAEPKLTFLINNDCKFVGSALTDCWGDNYKPKTNNIMSYPSNYYCRDNFTTGQVAIMLYMAASNKYSKHWSIDNKQNSKYAFDKTEPNDYFEMASKLKLNTTYTLNFHKILVGNGKNKADTCDWYKFELTNTNSSNIRISVNSKYNSQNITVALYDKNKIKLKEFTGKSNTAIELEYNNLVVDWYFVKVSHTDNNISKMPYEYSLRINN